MTYNKKSTSLSFWKELIKQSYTLRVCVNNLNCY